MRKLIGVALLIAFVSPAVAAEYYVVQDAKTKKCTIVDQRPTSSEMVIVGNGKVYATHSDAEAGMKTVTVCTSN